MNQCLAIKIFFLSIAAFSGGCYVKKTADTGQNSPVSTVEKDVSKDQILFLTFKIIKDSTAKAGSVVHWVNKQMADGRLKSKLQQSRTASADDLIFQFLDKRNDILFTEIIENPLTASTEYPDDNGTFSRVVLDKKEADLFLRVQQNALFYKLRIIKMTSNDNSVVIADFLM